MIHEELRSMLSRRPFIPFVLHVSDKTSYQITRPELVSVGNRASFIGLTRNTSSEYLDEPVLVSNIHITRLEPIVPETNPTPNL